MSAAQAIREARAIGVQLEIDGDDLVLKAPEAPPPYVLDGLSRHKAEVIKLLRRAGAEGASEPVWNASAKVLAYDPEALQAEADRRNRAASAAGLTDRWCACGALAPDAVGRSKTSRGNREGVGQWRCEECFGDWKTQPSSKLPAELEPHLRLNPVFEWFVQKGHLPTVEEYIGANWWGDPPLEEYDPYEQEFIDLLKKHQPPARDAMTRKQPGL